MTVPEVRALLVHLLEVRVWDVEEILQVVPLASGAKSSSGRQPPQATSRRAGGGGVRSRAREPAL